MAQATINNWDSWNSVRTDINSNFTELYTDKHVAVTVTDTAEIDLTLTGQDIEADLKVTAVTPWSYTTADITVDSKWRVTAASNWASSSSPLTTKWDVYTYDTADVRLWVWTNWQVLTADSAEAKWLKWSTPAWGWDMLAATYDPASVSEQLVWLTAIQTLTNKTLTTPSWIVTNDVTESTDKNYVTDAEATVIWNTSGTNSWDQTITLTWDVTWTWTWSFATTIAAKAVDVAMLADWTDWELITWSATWVAATVAVWTATHVLTSNWAWAAPTFQAAWWGWWASSPHFNVNIDWTQIVSTLYTYVCNWAITAWTFRTSLWVLPSGATLIVNLKKNWTTDATCTHTAWDSATNWLYLQTDTTFVSWSYAAGDVLTVEISQIWSSVAWSDLTFSLFE